MFENRSKYLQTPALDRLSGRLKDAGHARDGGGRFASKRCRSQKLCCAERRSRSPRCLRSSRKGDARMLDG